MLVVKDAHGKKRIRCFIHKIVTYILFSFLEREVLKTKDKTLIFLETIS
jgi:hypothetical protein